MAWNMDTTLQKQTGSNSDTTNFNYASYRPTSILNPDGTSIGFSYNDTTYPLYRRSVNGNAEREMFEFYDGFGRVIQTKKKSIGWYTYNFQDTVYGACSCTATGKAVRVSRPYQTGQTTTGWTETLYDALGRPTATRLLDSSLAVVANSTTSYVYSVENNGTWKGQLTTITDPAGKQKRYLHDAFGRLLRVDEPDSSNNLIETARYNYDVMGRMTKVEMGKRPDSTFKQTRTFVYNTKGQLLSATNPENGTVTYTYLSNGQVDTKTDAKGQVLKFIYL